MSIQQQVSRAIRILRGNRDVSARASHLVVQKDQLMTYESVFKGQAEMKKFFRSTFSERKIMSTKTSFKRIAAVAAVALTLGGFSAVSANAAVAFQALYHGSASVDCNAAASYACSDVSADKSFVAINKQADYGFQNTFLAGNAGDTSTATWSLTSSTTGFNTPSITMTAWKNTDAYGPSYTAPSGNGGGVGGWFLAGTANTSTGTAVANGTPTASGLAASTVATASGPTVGNFQASFVPTTAGTYVWTLTAGAVTHTWTVTAYATQAAADAALLAYQGVSSTPSATKSTAIVASGDTTTVAATDATISAGKTAASTATSAKATIVVTLKNAAGTDVTAYNTITASIAGVGNLAIGSASGLAAAGRAVTGTLGQNVIQVFADGSAGTGTITIASGTTTIATKTINFYGAAATITPTVVAPLFAVGTATGAITAVVKDANGNPVSGTPVFAVSDTAAAVSNSYAPCGSSSATGAVSCDLVGVAAGTANITLTTKSSATDASTTVVSAAPVAVRVGSASAASVKWSLDAATYVPGALVTASVTVLDAAGLPVVPGTYTVFTAAPTFSMAPATTSPLAASVVVAAGSTTGTTTYTFNAPLVAGDLTIKATTATLATAANSAVAVSLTASIAGGAAVDAAQAAQDAANEATDAANAATDAANNAMDSADAATAAAQDAGDKADAALAAITDLATKVSDIAAQVTALSALVAKIAAAVAKISAKVKA